MTDCSGAPAPATKPLAVVTGASSGIGFELTKVFASYGFDVLVNVEDTGMDVDAGLLPGGVQRLQVIPSVVRSGAAERAEGHECHDHFTDARPDRHQLLPSRRYGRHAGRSSAEG